MFWSRKKDTAPFGVPLEEIAASLAQASLKSTLTADAVLVRHHSYTTRITVAPVLAGPASGGGREGRVLVRVVTRLPPAAQTIFEAPDTVAMMNAFALLGAMSLDDGVVSLGSRLSLHAGDEAWSCLYLPLLTCVARLGVEAELGRLRGGAPGDGPAVGASAWSVRDLEEVRAELAAEFPCRVDGASLTVEFRAAGGRPDQVRHLANPAVLSLSADQPHSEIGPGLSCTTRLARRIPDGCDLPSITAHLNRLEMTGESSAPHFGAWCECIHTGGLAYVSFLPNLLRPVPRLVQHYARWTRQRVAWADGVIDRMAPGG